MALYSVKQHQELVLYFQLLGVLIFFLILYRLVLKLLLVLEEWLLPPHHLLSKVQGQIHLVLSAEIQLKQPLHSRGYQPTDMKHCWVHADQQ